MKPDHFNKSEEMLKQAVKRTLREIDTFKEASRLLPLQIEQELADFIRETEELLRQSTSRSAQENTGDERELRVHKLSIPGLRQALAAALPPVAVRRSVFSPGYPNRLKLKKAKSLRRVVKSRKKKAKAKRQARIIAAGQAQRGYPAFADRPQSHTGAIRERPQQAGGGQRGAGKASVAAMLGSGEQERKKGNVSAILGSGGREREWDKGDVSAILGSSEQEQDTGNVSAILGSGERERSVAGTGERSRRGTESAGDSGQVAAVSYVGRPNRAVDGGRDPAPPSQIGVVAVGAKWTHPDFSGASVWPQDRRMDNAKSAVVPVHTSSNLRFRTR